MRFDRLILALFLCVLPGAFWPGSTSYEAAKFLVLSLTCGAFLLNGAWRIGRGQATVRPTAKHVTPWLAFLAITFLSGALGANMSLVLRTTVLTAAWMIVLWISFTRTREVSHLQWLLRAMTLGAVVTSLYGLTQIHGLAAGPAPELGTPPGISTFGNENQMSGLAALAIWPALALIILTNNRIEKIAASLGLMVLLLAVLQAEATGPRLAVVGAALVIAPSSLLLYLGRRAVVPWYSLTVIVATAVAAVLVFARILEPQWTALPELPDLVTRWLAENNGNIRRTDWLVAWYMKAVNGPAFCGAGNYQALWPEVRAALSTVTPTNNLAEHIPVATRAHNEYIQAIAELGLPGALAVLNLMIVLLVGFCRRWQHIAAQKMALVWLLLVGFVLTFAIHALVSFPAHLPAPALTLAVVLGCLSAPVFGPDGFRFKTWKVPRAGLVLPVALGLIIVVTGARQFAGDLHLSRGEKLYLSGNFPQAQKELEQGQRLVTWSRFGDLYEGLTLMSLGRNDDALSSLLASLDHHPSYEAMLAAAELLTEKRDFPAALAQVARVQNCGPVDKFRWQARYLRGMVFLRQDDHKRARQVFDDLLADAPEFARGLLAAGYLSVLEGDPVAARLYYQRALWAIEAQIKSAATPDEKTRLGHMRDTARRAVESVR